MQAVTWLTVTGAFVLGLVLGLLGGLKLELGRRLNMGEAKTAGLLSAFHFSLLPMMLLTGLLIDRWGVRGVLITGCCFLCLALYLLTLRATYGWAVVSIFTLGVGFACLSTSTMVLMPEAFPTLGIAAALNLGNVFFALGALLAPPLAQLLLNRFGFRSLTFLAVACLTPILFAFCNIQFVGKGDQSELQPVLHDSRLWIAGLIFALYSPVEFCLTTWGTTFLTDQGIKEHRAIRLLSGFWLTFLAGRLAMVFLEYGHVFEGGHWQAWMIVLLALAAAVLLGNLAGTVMKVRAAIGVLALGFLLGPIFPTLVAKVFIDFPHARGTSYGAMFAIGAASSLASAPLIGLYARKRTVQESLRIPMVCALGASLAALVYALMRP